MENSPYNFMFIPLVAINIVNLFFLSYLRFTLEVLERECGENKKPYNLVLLDNIIRVKRPGLKGLVLLATKKMVINKKRTIIFFVILLGFVFFKETPLKILIAGAFFNFLLYLLCKVELTKNQEV